MFLREGEIDDELLKEKWCNWGNETGCHGNQTQPKGHKSASVDPTPKFFFKNNLAFFNSVSFTLTRGY